jgi:hypothetical protein
MARGGYRPGAGRPRGAKSKTRAKLVLASAPIVTHPAARDLDPMAYLLAVMRDENAEPSRRDRAAIAIAPFIHPRVGDRYGKKDHERDQARRAARGKFAAPPMPPYLLHTVPLPGEDEGE